MSEYLFVYLFMGIFFLPFWLYFFFTQKKRRLEMIVMSLFFAPLGPLTNVLYEYDWWQPEYIFGFDFESLFVAFLLTGIGTALYRRPALDIHEKPHYLKFFIFVLVSNIAFWGSFYVFHANSFLTTLITFLVMCGICLYTYPQLFFIGVRNGVYLLGIACLVYTLLSVIFPGWIHAFYFFKNVPDIVILNLTLDDIVYYFFFGFYMTFYWSFWHSQQLPKKIPFTLRI